MSICLFKGFSIADARAGNKCKKNNEKLKLTGNGGKEKHNHVRFKPLKTETVISIYALFKATRLL